MTPFKRKVTKVTQDTGDAIRYDPPRTVLVPNWEGLPRPGQKPTRPSWDEYGLGLARSASARGDCTRRQVGAVVMDQNHRIVGAGYNGYPSGEPGCLSAGACPRGRLSYAEQPPGTGYAASGCKAIHAEVNAVEHALSPTLKGRAAPELTVYISDEPCDLCREYLTDPNHYVLRVVWPDGMLVRDDLSKEFTE